MQTGQQELKLCRFADDMILYLKVHKERIPRWRLEVGSRKRASYSEILERRWRHTLQA
jgi:hypothetical protein